MAVSVLGARVPRCSVTFRFGLFFYLSMICGDWRHDAREIRDRIAAIVCAPLNHQPSTLRNLCNVSVYFIYFFVLPFHVDFFRRRIDIDWLLCFQMVAISELNAFAVRSRQTSGRPQASASGVNCSLLRCCIGPIAIIVSSASASVQHTYFNFI